MPTPRRHLICHKNEKASGRNHTLTVVAEKTGQKQPEKHGLSAVFMEYGAFPMAKKHYLCIIKSVGAISVLFITDKTGKSS